MSDYANAKVTELAKIARERGLTFTTKTKKADLVAMLETHDATNAVVDGNDYTTDALAVIFETSAKALRVELRRLGLGVGKGSRYHFNAAGLANLKTQLSA